MCDDAHAVIITRNSLLVHLESLATHDVRDQNLEHLQCRMLCQFGQTKDDSLLFRMPELRTWHRLPALAHASRVEGSEAACSLSKTRCGFLRTLV
eukprot:4293323-Amphidinium_carterae.4